MYNNIFIKGQTRLIMFVYSHPRGFKESHTISRSIRRKNRINLNEFTQSQVARIVQRQATQPAYFSFVAEFDVMNGLSVSKDSPLLWGKSSSDVFAHWDVKFSHQVDGGILYTGIKPMDVVVLPRNICTHRAADDFYVAWYTQVPLRQQSTSPVTGYNGPSAIFTLQDGDIFYIRQHTGASLTWFAREATFRVFEAVYE